LSLGYGLEGGDGCWLGAARCWLGVVGWLWVGAGYWFGELFWG
jgi:hypothetical protein